MTKNIVLCGWKSGVMVNTVTSQQKGPEFEANWGFFVCGLHVNRHRCKCFFFVLALQQTGDVSIAYVGSHLMAGKRGSGLPATNLDKTNMNGIKWMDCAVNRIFFKKVTVSIIL